MGDALRPQDLGAGSDSPLAPTPANGRWRVRDPWIHSEAEAIEEAGLAHAPDDRPEPPVAQWRDRLSTVSAVSAGGLLGANARYVVGMWVSDRWGSGFPWATLLINVSGCFVLGLYLMLVAERFAGRATTRLFFATGFLGAYTTFSTFSYEATRFLQDGQLLRALAYVAASLTIGLMATAAGMVSARVF